MISKHGVVAVHRLRNMSIRASSCGWCKYFLVCTQVFQDIRVLHTTLDTSIVFKKPMIVVLAVAGNDAALCPPQGLEILESASGANVAFDLALASGIPDRGGDGVLHQKVYITAFWEPGHAACRDHQAAMKSVGLSGFCQQVPPNEVVYYAARNKFERFRGFLQLINRFEFEFCRCVIFFEGFEFFWCVQSSITHNVACLCPHNSTSSVVVSMTTCIYMPREFQFECCGVLDDS